MNTGITRRAWLAGAIFSLAVRHAAATTPPTESDFAAQLGAIQSEIGGRLGVCVLDTGSQRMLSFNDEHRFAMCSTFKLLLAAAILAQVDAGRLSLEREVQFGPGDMLSHAPVTSARLAEGRMSVRDLCAATVELSDNPAANLLLPLIGGPAGLTKFLRGIGDRTTRLDRTELSLNSNIPGDPRDTTTPRAMVQTVAKLLTESPLSTSSRALLTEWLIKSPTGARRIRAGLPADWKAGDKTGTGANGAVNDVVITWPPQRSPIVAAIYMSESTRPVSTLEQTHSRIGGLIANALRT